MSITKSLTNLLRKFVVEYESACTLIFVIIYSWSFIVMVLMKLKSLSHDSRAEFTSSIQTLNRTKRPTVIWYDSVCLNIYFFRVICGPTLAEFEPWIRRESWWNRLRLPAVAEADTEENSLTEVKESPSESLKRDSKITCRRCVSTSTYIKQRRQQMLDEYQHVLIINDNYLFTTCRCYNVRFNQESWTVS